MRRVDTFPTRVYGPVLVERTRWPWRERWRVTVRDLAVNNPVGWSIYDVVGEGRSFQAALLAVEDEHRRLNAVNAIVRVRGRS